MTGRIRFSREDFDAAVKQHFPGAKHGPLFGNSKRLGHKLSLSDRDLFLEYEPMRNAATIDFGYKPGESEEVDVNQPKQRVQKGSKDFATRLKGFLPVLASRGVGLHYLADKRHSEAYGRLLKRMGWRLSSEKASNQEGYNQYHWLPPAAKFSRQETGLTTTDFPPHFHERSTKPDLRTEGQRIRQEDGANPRADLPDVEPDEVEEAASRQNQQDRELSLQEPHVTNLAKQVLLTGRSKAYHRLVSLGLRGYADQLLQQHYRKHQYGRGIHSPKGGVMVRGVHYPAGKFIPAAMLEKASYDQYQQVEKQRHMKKYQREDGSFDLEEAKKYAKNPGYTPGVDPRVEKVRRTLGRGGFERPTPRTTGLPSTPRIGSGIRRKDI